MAWEALKKIAINFAVVFIVASIFSSVAPGTAHKAYAFFEDKLGFGEPSIGYFTVAVDEKNNAQFIVKYGILGNYRDVEKVIVSRGYGKSPDAKISERFKIGTLSLEGVNVAKDLTDYEGKMYGVEKIEDFKRGMGLAGVHRFTIEVYLSSMDVDSKDAEILIYDDAYIQLFKGGVKGCVKRGAGDKKGMDPLSLKNCDVDARKRVELSALSTGGGSNSKDEVIAAWKKAGFDDKSACKYEKASGFWLGSKHWLSDECTPEEVDRVWSEYLKIMVATKNYVGGSFSGHYYCTGPLYSDSSYVCKVKRQVVMTLNKLGWTDLREHKGWEVNV